MSMVHPGPIQRTLAGQVAAELHRLILDGTLPAGSMLRIQELAERFNTSAMPVREALRNLDGLGLVEMVPHKGTRVAELTESDLNDTYDTRIALETIAISKAATNFTPEAAREAAELLSLHTKLLDRGEIAEARSTHTDFHFRLYRESGSLWLLRAIEVPWRNSERYAFVLRSTPEARQHSHQEHEEILEACTQRDSKRAASSMRTHLDSARTRIAAAMQEGH